MNLFEAWYDELIYWGAEFLSPLYVMISIAWVPIVFVSLVVILKKNLNRWYALSCLMPLLSDILLCLISPNMKLVAVTFLIVNSLLIANAVYQYGRARKECRYLVFTTLISSMFSLSFHITVGVFASV